MRVAALGLVIRGSTHRKLQATGLALVSVGFFLGLKQHTITLTAAKPLRGRTGGKGKFSGSKYKQVNFNKEDLVADTENTIFAKRASLRGRRDSFMAMAAVDLEADFARQGEILCVVVGAVQFIITIILDLNIIDTDSD